MEEATEMALTVEQFEQLLLALKTQDGSEAAILVFTGILALSGIIFIMWWVLNLKLKPLEELSKSLSSSIKELNTQIQDLSTKMWSAEALDNKIKVAVAEQIQEHIKNCPYKDQFNK